MVVVFGFMMEEYTTACNCFKNMFALSRARQVTTIYTIVIACMYMYIQPFSDLVFIFYHALCRSI